MATTPDYIEYVAESLAFAGDVRYKKMFGEYMVYVNEKPLILVCDNTAFVKKLPCLYSLMVNAEIGFPYKGAREHYILDIEDTSLAECVVAEPDKATPPPKTKVKKPSTPKTANPIGDYIAAQDKRVQPRLDQIYASIKSALPDALEKISYQMPTFRGKRNLIHFAAFKNHIGVYPGAEAIEHFADRLAGYKTSKGTIQFPHEKPLPLELIKEIAAWCASANIAS
jgi:uncharacterized protein YdhG (YjbR/CyaY superfamily)